MTKYFILSVLLFVPFSKFAGAQEPFDKVACRFYGNAGAAFAELATVAKPKEIKQHLSRGHAATGEKFTKLLQKHISRADMTTVYQTDGDLPMMLAKAAMKKAFRVTQGKKVRSVADMAYNLRSHCRVVGYRAVLIE